MVSCSWSDLERWAVLAVIAMLIVFVISLDATHRNAIAELRQMTASLVNSTKTHENRTRSLIIEALEDQGVRTPGTVPGHLVGDMPAWRLVHDLHRCSHPKVFEIGDWFVVLMFGAFYMVASVELVLNLSELLLHPRAWRQYSRLVLVTAFFLWAAQTAASRSLFADSFVCTLHSTPGEVVATFVAISVLLGWMYVHSSSAWQSAKERAILAETPGGGVRA